MLGGSAGFYWTGEGVAAHWDGFRRGGVHHVGVRLGDQQCPPPPPPPPPKTKPPPNPPTRGGGEGGEY